MGNPAWPPDTGRHSCLFPSTHFTSPWPPLRLASNPRLSSEATCPSLPNNRMEILHTWISPLRLDGDSAVKKIPPLLLLPWVNYPMAAKVALKYPVPDRVSEPNDTGGPCENFLLKENERGRIGQGGRNVRSGPGRRDEAGSAALLCAERDARTSGSSKRVRVYPHTQYRRDAHPLLCLRHRAHAGLSHPSPYS
jgi:hypothetical protein